MLSPKRIVLSSFIMGLALSVAIPSFAQAPESLPEAMPETTLVPVEADAAAAPETADIIQKIEPLEAVETPSESALVEPAPETQQLLPEIPEAEEVDGFDENIFFDAESLVPTGEMGRKAGPRKVDPRVQPGSRLVVAKQSHRASSKTAQVVAAERAMKLGRYESALAMYDELYARNKSDPNIMLARAIALQKLGHDEEALAAYEMLLDKRPNSVEAKINMSGLIAKRYPSVALQQLLQLHDQNPRNIGVIAQVAVVQAKLAQFDEALRYLGMAASMEPENASHIYNMAIIADRAGSKKEAVDYYEMALETDTLYGAGRTIPREAVFERLAQLR